MCNQYWIQTWIEGKGLGITYLWVQLPALPPIKCAALSKLLDASIFSWMGPIINRDSAEKTNEA